MTDSKTRAAFEAFWAQERAMNGGVEIGADYRHWALVTWQAAHRAALEEAIIAFTELADEDGRWTAEGLRAIAAECLAEFRTLADDGTKD